ncbi:MAG TPA: acetylornithine deacetylase [Planctomycetaceae bacterium]|nr:acetylornithine deacetylase [Planctomycetaceae bacterium]
MGRDLSGPEYYETRVSDWLCGFFAERDIAHERIEVVPGRSNVVARVDAGADRPTVILDAHQDTVPVDGMTIDPFDPVVRDGKIYGRGSCDVKGGMAAMLHAVARLASERPEGAANVVMSCTCDEESNVQGITDLVRLWTDDDRHCDLIPKRPDVALVAEPTLLDIVVAHRGATRWKVRTTGRACHSSQPEQGVNAIYRMARVVHALEDYADTLADRVTPHPLCGEATLSVGLVSGGVSVNTVPDECLIEVDRRVIPGENGAEVIDDVRDHLEQNVDVPFEFLPPWLVGIPLPDEGNGDWARRLQDHIASITGPRQLVGVPYGTHASRFAASGVPGIVCGPGSIQQAHTRDEWLEVAELEQAAEIYYRFCSHAV